MKDIKISVFASVIRPNLWEEFFKSLESTTEEYEVIFSGPCECPKKIKYPKNFTFIKTRNIKPAQCYEIARRACKGETISWTADDCEYSEDCLGKAYRFWKEIGKEKLALSIQTIEDGYKYDMNDHSFVGFDRTTPLMAPVVLMSRKLMETIGGFDFRFVCGQYENDAIMKLYRAGGNVLIFNEGFVTIDHEKKHKESHDFRKGDTMDRKVLEEIWGEKGEKLFSKLVTNITYYNHNITKESQSNNNKSVWE